MQKIPPKDFRDWESVNASFLVKNIWIVCDCFLFGDGRVKR